MYVVCRITFTFPVSVLHKSTAGRYVRVADGPITARHRFIKNAGWVVTNLFVFTDNLF